MTSRYIDLGETLRCEAVLPQDLKVGDVVLDEHGRALAITSIDHAEVADWWYLRWEGSRYDYPTSLRGGVTVLVVQDSQDSEEAAA